MSKEKDYPKWCPGSEYCKTNDCAKCEYDPKKLVMGISELKQQIQYLFTELKIEIGGKPINSIPTQIAELKKLINIHNNKLESDDLSMANHLFDFFKVKSILKKQFCDTFLKIMSEDFELRGDTERKAITDAVIQEILEKLGNIIKIKPKIKKSNKLIDKLLFGTPITHKDIKKSSNNSAYDLGIITTTKEGELLDYTPSEFVKKYAKNHNIFSLIGAMYSEEPEKEPSNDFKLTNGKATEFNAGYVTGLNQAKEIIHRKNVLLKAFKEKESSDDSIEEKRNMLYKFQLEEIENEFGDGPLEYLKKKEKQEMIGEFLSVIIFYIKDAETRKGICLMNYENMKKEHPINAQCWWDKANIYTVIINSLNTEKEKWTQRRNK